MKTTIVAALAAVTLVGAPTGSARTAPSCVAVSRGLVSTTLGQPVVRSYFAVTPMGNQCVYYVARSALPLAFVVYVAGEKRQAFEALARSPRNHAVLGIGEAAYYFAVHRHGLTASATPEFALFVLTQAGSFEIDAFASLPSVETLARRIVPLVK